MSDRTLTPSSFANITTSDTVPQPKTIGIYVGGAGNLVVKGSDGIQATLAVIAGQYVPGRFSFVMAATTATGLVAGIAE